MALVLGLGGCGPGLVATGDEVGDEASSSSEGTSSDTTSASESEDEDGTDWTTMGFVPENDASLVPECDSWIRDCPEGEKCVPYASSGGTWDAHKCVPIMGDQQAGEPCVSGGPVEAWDDCDAASMCWDVEEVDGELVGECVGFCQGSADDPECPPGHTCLIDGNGTFNLCIENCNPLAPNCSEGLGCFWANTGFQCIFTTQDIPAGEPCGYINDCVPGTGCTLAEKLPNCAGESCCAAFCDLLLGDVGCRAQPGTSCLPFFDLDPPPAGYESLGHCVLP